jgi:hypothetical protein
MSNSLGTKKSFEKCTSSQLAIDQMERRSESMLSLLSESTMTDKVPALNEIDDPDFIKAKKGCDLNFTPSRRTLNTLDKDNDSDNSKSEDLWSGLRIGSTKYKMSDPWSVSSPQPAKTIVQESTQDDKKKIKK